MSRIVTVGLTTYYRIWIDAETDEEALAEVDWMSNGEIIDMAPDHVRIPVRDSTEIEEEQQPDE